MEKKLFLNLVIFENFNTFSEYFICISIIYVLIVGVLITYNIYGLVIQQAFSDCIVLVLLMTVYLIFNDNLLMFNFLTFNNSFINDYLALFAKTLICVFSIIYFLIISNFLKEQKLISFEYLLIILFAILGILFMCSSNDLIIAYLAIELSSLAFYILASFRKVSNYSIESGVKYFIMGAISSAFFLLGSSFVYGLTGSINFSDFQDLFELSIFYFDAYAIPLNIKYNELLNIIYTLMFIDSSQLLNFDGFFGIRFVEFGLTLILFSLFIKLALAPFHLWSLDVYEGSPTNSTFFFAVITKLSILVLLIRFCYQSFFVLKFCWQFYLVWVGLFSIFIGSFGGLKQRKLKTLLAYSSVGHMGYVLIALSTSTFVGIQMFLFYIFVYMLSSLVVWNIILLLRLKKKKFENKYNKELSDLVLLKKSNVMLAFFLCITMFSISGIPPIVGFLSKMSVFLSIISISFYFIAFLSIIFSVASTFYYIRIIKILYFENLLIGKLYYPIKTLKTFVLSFLIFSLVYFFFNPTILYLINYKVILCLF